MWYLIVVVLSTTAPYQSRGTLSIPFQSQEQCVQAKEKILKNIVVENSRFTASCTVRGYQ